MKEEKDKHIRLIITGGGTGGHLFPGIALAQAMMQEFPGCEVLFIGTERKIDKTALAAMGFKTTTIKSQGLKGKSLGAKLSALLHLPASLLEAIKIIRNFKPDLVFGVGGYVTGPVVLAAKLLGVTTCIHEQNSIPGLANKMLGHVADKIFVSLPGSEKYFPARKTIFSGNPVRHAILKKARDMKTGNKNEPPTLLVLGGSQGARRLNSLLLEAAEKCLADIAPPLRIIHQTGEHDMDFVRQRYAELGLNAQVEAFYTDMASLYAEADLVVSRAGATTLAEITVFHKPVILVPFPYAADNHQEINGRYLVEAGGALMFRQADLSGEKLGLEIKRILADEKFRAQMAQNLKRIARPEATKIIVTACIELMRDKFANSAGKILAF